MVKGLRRTVAMIKGDTLPASEVRDDSLDSLCGMEEIGGRFAGKG